MNFKSVVIILILSQALLAREPISVAVSSERKVRTKAIIAFVSVACLGGLVYLTARGPSIAGKNLLDMPTPIKKPDVPAPVTVPPTPIKKPDVPAKIFP